MSTAKKYITMPEDKISALDYRTVYKKRKNMFDDYINIIYKMLRDKIYPPIINSYIIRSGYDGNIDALDTKIRRVAKNNFNIKLGINWAYKFAYSKDILVVKRNEVLRYITTRNPKTKRNENIDKYIDIIKERYRTVEELQYIYNDFHETIMGKDPSSLQNFIDKHQFSIAESFVSGLKDDFISVRNAISSDISSGFVEGNNNKFKLIKRILYGRASLHTLFKKCYLAFKFGLDEFNISQLTNTAQAIVPK